MSLALASSLIVSAFPAPGTYDCPTPALTVLAVSSTLQADMTTKCHVEVTRYKVGSPNSLKIVSPEQVSITLGVTADSECIPEAMGILSYELVIDPRDWTHSGDLRAYTCVPKFQ